MAEINIRFEAHLSRTAVYWGLVLGSVLLFPVVLSSESVTLTTYYPAPSGVYTNMLTTQNTWLATQPGYGVGIGTPSPIAGMTLQVHSAANQNLAVASQGGNINVGAVNDGGTVNTLQINGSPAIFSGGNVGVGTASPSSALDLGTASSLDGQLTIEGTQKCEPADNNGNIPITTASVGDACATATTKCPADHPYATWAPGVYMPNNDSTGWNWMSPGAGYIIYLAKEANNQGLTFTQFVNGSTGNGAASLDTCAPAMFYCCQL